MTYRINQSESGWIHIRWNTNMWCQIPPGFADDVIPDEYIFHPEWTREWINVQWRQEIRQRILTIQQSNRSAHGDRAAASDLRSEEAP